MELIPGYAHHGGIANSVYNCAISRYSALSTEINMETPILRA